jgi:predicted PurR-regulated permease PerM
MKEYPFWLKFIGALVGLTLLGVLLSYGKFILMPLAFSALFAILLTPLSARLEPWRLGRAGAIIVAMLIVTVALSGILSLFTWQFVQFAADLPQVLQRLKEIGASILQFADSTLGIAPEEQTGFLRQGLDSLIDRSGQYVTGLVNTTTNLFTVLGLMPVFVFCLLYYRDMYDTFLKNIVDKKNRSQVDLLVEKIQRVVQNYLVGLVIVILILAVMNSVGLLIVGIKHAVFFGVFASFMAIIPYVGIIIGGLPPLDGLAALPARRSRRVRDRAVPGGEYHNAPGNRLQGQHQPVHGHNCPDDRRASLGNIWDDPVRTAVGRIESGI